MHTFFRNLNEMRELVDECSTCDSYKIGHVALSNKCAKKLFIVAWNPFVLSAIMINILLQRQHPVREMNRTKLLNYIIK